MATEERDPLIRLPFEILDTIDAVALAADRSRGWVIERALRQYLSAEGEEVLSIAASRKSASIEPLEDFDDVIADVGRIVAGEPGKAA